MPMRKWSVLVASLACFSAVAAGVSVAQDEETKLADLMEKVTASNNKISRSLRNKVSFTKANNGKDASKEAANLLELGKKARANDEALPNAKDVDEPKKKWEELMDEMIKKTEELVKAADGGDFDAAKAAHTGVKNACTECHKVFKVEEDF